MTEIVRLLQFACPLGMAALGEGVGQKAGIINIGLEGQMLVSAYAALVVAIDSGSPWLGMGAGVLVALAYGLVQAWFTVRQGLDQVVVGTAANLGALGLTGTLFRSRFGQSGQLLSVEGFPSWGGMDPILILFLLAPIGVWWLLGKTGWGLAARAAGENPKAAEAAGFAIAKLRVQAVVASSLLAGVAGAYLTLGVNRSFAEGMTGGRGFVAIAMVTFGRWKPGWVAAACLLVGYAESLQFTLQLQGSGIPYQFFKALPYLLALAVLVAAGKGALAPRALGTPYRREGA